MTRFARILFAAPLLAASLFGQAVGNSSSVEGVQNGVLQRGADNGIADFKFQNLIDHGGKVLPASHTYLIWWGDSTQWPSDATAGIQALMSGFNGTTFLGIGQQYMRGAGISSSYVNSASDSSAPPSGSPSTATIVNEACKTINANGWKADPNFLYLVLTSNFPSNVNFCAWHDHGSCNGTDIQVAYMPNTTGVSGCDPGNQFSCNSYSQGTRSLANVISHEFMETITDADISAWYDRRGSEIGDKCAWTFTACVNLTSGKWQLQQEWSNAIGKCAQQ
jgi:hypothetical protein